MRLIFGSILVWLIFVMSLAGWWLYYGITTLSNADALKIPSQLAKHQRMLFTEGIVLLVCLLSGGLALFYFSWRMYKEKSAKEMFFASFTHDLKTALFRLQLEVEKSTKDEPSQKLLGHTRKMQLDLENGLDSTIGHHKKLYLENINLKECLVDLHAQWPELSIQYSGETLLRADRKALNSVLKNLLHNSFVHGEADQVRVNLSKSSSQFELIYEDNGKTYEGDPSRLGLLRERTMGSGFGLFIVRQWVKKLNGRIEFFINESQSLGVKIKLPGAA